MADHPGKLRVTLDGVASQTGQRLDLRYTLANRDNFNYHSTGITFTVVALFFGDGAISPWPTLSFNPGLGANPGQTVAGTMSLGPVFSDGRCDFKLHALIEDPRPVPDDSQAQKEKPDMWTEFLPLTGLQREEKVLPQCTLYNLNVCK